jgi:hypothetical protein
MKCSEFQKQIYLYPEMTMDEKSLLDKHIALCEDCNKLMERFSHTDLLIQKARSFKPEVKNPEWVTQRVMIAIEKNKKANVLDGVIMLIDNYFVRFAVSLVSLFLVSFFIYEQQSINVHRNRERSSQLLKQGIKLDMKAFSVTYRKRKENKTAESSNSRYAFYKSQRAEIKL